MTSSDASALGVRLARSNGGRHWSGADAGHEEDGDRLPGSGIGVLFNHRVRVPVAYVASRLRRSSFRLAERRYGS
jgi:hypothetical protein